MRSLACVLSLALAAIGCTRSPKPQPAAAAADGGAAAPTTSTSPTPTPTPEPATPSEGDLPAPPDVAAPPADAEKTASGLASKVLQPGKGTEKPEAQDQVTVHYTGWTTDGKMFDSSVKRGQPATFPLNGVIKGWTEGLQLMVEGEKRRFWIPVELAYNNRPGRPAGMLVFDVELISIKRGPKPIPAPPDVAAIPKDAKTTASGLAWKQLTPPTGKDAPKDGSIVKMHYTGWSTDGKMVDSSVVREQPVSFRLETAPPGFKEGLAMMTAGEKRRFWIPKKLALRGGGGDTPGDFLVFDVELLQVIDMSAPADVAKAPADAEKTKSGLASKVLTKGTGTAKPGASSLVRVHYTGWTTDGKMFDSSVARGEPAEFALNGVIPGWTEGLQLMVEGEKRRFWIPEELAYKGKEGPQGLLVFDVELVKIVKE
jgi:FKBP-type peptidyl-prolyl cis-trans isomerase